MLFRLTEEVLRFITNDVQNQRIVLSEIQISLSACNQPLRLPFVTMSCQKLNFSKEVCKQIIIRHI